MENTEENSEKIWILWKKRKLSSEKIWKISVLVIVTLKETSSSYLLLSSPSFPSATSPPFGVTSFPVAMSVMRNGTFCTIIVRTKRGKQLCMRTR